MAPRVLEHRDSLVKGLEANVFSKRDRLCGSACHSAQDNRPSNQPISKSSKRRPQRTPAGSAAPMSAHQSFKFFMLLVVSSFQISCALAVMPLVSVMDPLLEVKHKSMELVHATYKSNHHGAGHVTHMSMMSTHSNYSIHANIAGASHQIVSKRFAIGMFPSLFVDILGSRFLLVDMPAVGSVANASVNDAFKGKPSPAFFQLKGALPDETTLVAWVKQLTGRAHNHDARLLVDALHGAWCWVPCAAVCFGHTDTLTRLRVVPW